MFAFLNIKMIAIKLFRDNRGLLEGLHSIFAICRSLNYLVTLILPPFIEWVWKFYQYIPRTNGQFRKYWLIAHMIMVILFDIHDV